MAKLFTTIALALGLGSQLVAQDSCTACHPGALRGLSHSAHATLPAQRPGDACIVCHGASDAHVQSAKQAGLDRTSKVAKPAAVKAASCVACHAGKEYAVASGAHAFVRKVTRESGTQDPASRPSSARSTSEARTSEPESKPLRTENFEWSALVAAGFRFVDIDGSRDRYDSDVRLHRGFRLSEFEATGKNSDPNAPFQSALVRAEDIGDPWMRVSADFEKIEGKRRSQNRATWTKSRNAYRAQGEFHRVDQRSDELALAFTQAIGEDSEYFGSFERRLEDGFWLTERVGNRNLSPVGAVDDVASPREYDSKDFTIGGRRSRDGLSYSAAFEYHDDDSRDRWSYARTSTVNPAFPESETFLSNTSVRGPGARGTLSKKFEKLTVSLAARFLERKKRVRGNGTTEGFDIGEFTTTTTAFASGRAKTWIVDVGAGYEVTDTIALDLDLRWRDHTEKLSIESFDETVYPGLNSRTDVTTRTNPRTSQRVLDGTASVDWQALKEIALSAGYGFSRETLRLPDLEAADADFASGTIRSDGVLLGARWKPSKELRAEVQARSFGMGGAQLHELTQDEQRSLSAKVRYQKDGWHAAAFWKTTEVENARVSYRNHAMTTGASGGWSLGEALELDGGYVFAELDSRVLTNFYFDPDPNPVPTFVGFRGDTQTWNGGLTWTPGQRFEARASGAYTTTNGTFDLDTFDWRVDLRYEVLRGGQVGVLFRQLDYSEQGRADDYDAKLLMVYWRQRIGRAQ